MNEATARTDRAGAPEEPPRNALGRSAPARLDPALVATALRLTPMESQVAVRIAAGQTVPEIAVALGRTSGAVHWHLRHIYQKHGLRGHADLVRLVLSLTTLA